MRTPKLIFSLFLLSASVQHALSQVPEPRFSVLVLAMQDHHSDGANAGSAWIEQLGRDSNFSVDVIQDLEPLSPDYLGNYDVIFQVNWRAFCFTPGQQAAMEEFIAAGKGWIGIHGAGITRSPDNLSAAYHDGWGDVPAEYDWPWYRDYLATGNYVNHPAFQEGTVVFEDRAHPVTAGMPETWRTWEEWYVWDQDARENGMRILAYADQSSYDPAEFRTEDLPLLWVNEDYDRMVYTSIGHMPELYEDDIYTTLLTNAIMWAAQPAFTGTETLELNRHTEAPRSAGPLKRSVRGRAGDGASNGRNGGRLPAGIYF